MIRLTNILSESLAESERKARSVETGRLVSAQNESAAAANSIRDAIDRVNENVEALSSRIKDLIGEKAIKSAGGIVGPVSSSLEQPSGHPWATGDVRLSFNDTPNGWLDCNGTQRNANDFKELFQTITRSGIATTNPGTAFILPDLSPVTTLTDNTAGTANDTLQAVPDPADTPLTADALRDDLVANAIPAIRNNFADLAAKVNLLLSRLFGQNATWIIRT